MPNHYRICRAKAYSAAKFHYIDITLDSIIYRHRFPSYMYIFYSILHTIIIINHAFLKQEENDSLYDTILKIPFRRLNIEIKIQHFTLAKMLVFRNVINVFSLMSYLFLTTINSDDSSASDRYGSI